MTILINGTPVSGITTTCLIMLIVALTGQIACFISERSKYTAQIALVVFQYLGFIGIILLMLSRTTS